MIKDMQEVIDEQTDVKCTDHACTLRGCSTSIYVKKRKQTCTFPVKEAVRSLLCSLYCRMQEPMQHHGTILHTDTDKITGDGMETYCNHFAFILPVC